MSYEIIKKRNYLVDIFKFIAATMVVGIHCAPLNSYNQFLNNVIFQGVSRIAVPFFFMISSFFLFSKMKLEVGKEKKVLIHYIKRMGLLYLFWFIVFLPQIIKIRYEVFVPIYGRRKAVIILLNSILWCSSFQGSWYLNASIICAVLVFMLDKKMGKKMTYCISGMCFVLSTTLGSYYEVFSQWIPQFYEKCIEPFWPPYNTFVIGMLYFVIGKYIAETKKEKLAFWEIRKPMLVISVLLVVFEATYMHTHTFYHAPDSFFSLLPATYFIVICVVYSEININISDKIIKFLRDSSVIMYIVHFAILRFWTNMEIEFSNSLLKYFATICVSLGISFGIVKLEKIKMLGFLRFSH